MVSQKEDQWLFEGSFKCVSKIFKEVFRLFQGGLRGVPRICFFSRKIEGCFNGVLSGFQACLNEVEWVFEGSFQSVSRMFSGHFKGVLRKIVG